MITISDDKWLWLGLGLMTFVALRAVSHQLQQVRTFTKVNEETVRPTMLDQDTEDALKLDTLRKLAEGPSYELRVAAIKIICERSVIGPTFQLLLQNVASPDPQTRADALIALRFLCASPSFMKLINYPTFHAIVTALDHCLKDPARSTFPQRSPPERHALSILSLMLPQDINLALKAGIIKRWLAHYPFGRTEAETHEAIKKLRTFGSNDRLMSEIIGVLENHPEARKQMRIAGLTGSSIGESSDEDDRMLDPNELAEMSGWLAPRRLRDDTPEERRRRRRRREAVVVSDGSHPLSRADIIQRRDTGVTDNEVEMGPPEFGEQTRSQDGVAQIPGWRPWVPWR